MEYNNTTSKNGLIQDFEQWCGLSDGTISGDATQLKIVTGWINREFDSILPLVLSYTDHVRWDDSNHTDFPVGTFSISPGQGDYTFTTDDNSLSILNLVGVSIITSSGGSEYEPLERITLDDPRALRAISPNPSDSGVPSGFVEKGNTIFFDKKFNYTKSAGGKIYFERDPSYFDSSDTTKEPGIPKPFHQLLSMRSARRWLLRYKPSATELLTFLNAEIEKKERQLSDLTERRNPTRRRMTTSYGGNRGAESGRLGVRFSDSNK